MLWVSSFTDHNLSIISSSTSSISTSHSPSSSSLLSWTSGQSSFELQNSSWDFVTHTGLAFVMMHWLSMCGMVMMSGMCCCGVVFSWTCSWSCSCSESCHHWWLCCSGVCKRHIDCYWSLVAAEDLTGVFKVCFDDRVELRYSTESLKHILSPAASLLSLNKCSDIKSHHKLDSKQIINHTKSFTRG